MIGRLAAADTAAGGRACTGDCEGEEYLDPLRLGTVPATAPAAAGRAATWRAARRRAGGGRCGARAGDVGSLVDGGPRVGTDSPARCPGGITSPFGMRFHPILHVWKLHDGTDFGAACGTPIRAPYAGRVAVPSTPVTATG